MNYALHWTLALAATALIHSTVVAQQLDSRAEADPAAQIASRRNVTLFPSNDLFPALVADPKEQTFFMSLLGGSSPSRGSRTGSVGMGATVAIVRWVGPEEGDGLEFGLSGAVFAQFDLTRSSHDLINADYVVGLPVSYRRGPYAIRFRAYHQSSHLGDEFVENNQVERLNLSFESFELLVSRDFGPLRTYGGGEFRFNRIPHDSLEHGVLHGGIEYRHPAPLMRVGAWGALRPVAAVDAQSFQYRDWRVGWSGRAGIELGPVGDGARGGRTVSFLVEVYDGPNPYGQFFAEDISSIGFGAHFAY